MTLSTLLLYTQSAVSQAVYVEVKRALPLSMADLIKVTERYGIRARFVPRGQSLYGACDSDLNRWTC